METIIGGASADPVPSESVIETSTEGFAADVLEASRQVPVIVDFWAPWCAPCRELGPVLEKVVHESRGAVRLVKLDIEAHPAIAQQLRIQSIPAVFAFKDGQPVDGFVGALPESQLRSFVERLGAANSGEETALQAALEHAKQALAEGDFDTATALFTQIHERDPALAAAIAGLARCLLARNQRERAQQLLDQAPEAATNDPEIVAVRAALELAGQNVEPDRVPAYQAALSRNPNDHQARFDLATADYAAGRREQAVDGLLEIVRRDRKWNDEAARKQLLKLFEAFGPTDPLTIEARRRLSAIVFA